MAAPAPDKQLERAADYLYRNAPYDNSAELGRSVYSFGGKELVKFILESTHKKSGLKDIDKDEGAIELMDKLLAAGYFHAVMPSPDGRPNWYVPAPRASPAATKYVKSNRQKYVWDYKESKTKLTILLTLLVVVAIGACLFPVWPMWMKRGLHYILVTFLAFVAIFLLIRALLYGAVWLVGYEFWVLPNVLSDDEDMFKPWYSFQKAEEVKVWHRGVAVAVLGVVVYWIVTQPDDFERLLTAQRQFMDDLYSGALLGDATQADRDRMRADANIDEEMPDFDRGAYGDDAQSSDKPAGSAGGKADVGGDGYVHTDYDHLDFEPDVPLGEGDEEE